MSALPTHDMDGRSFESHCERCQECDACNVEACREHEIQRKLVHAVETLRVRTNDEAPRADDFAAVAKKLNAERFAPPSGKRWTSKHVLRAFELYCADELVNH